MTTQGLGTVMHTYPHENVRHRPERGEESVAAHDSLGVHLPLQHIYAHHTAVDGVGVLTRGCLYHRLPRLTTHAHKAYTKQIAI